MDDAGLSTANNDGPGNDAYRRMRVALADVTARAKGGKL